LSKGAFSRGHGTDPTGRNATATEVVADERPVLGVIQGGGSGKDRDVFSSAAKEELGENPAWMRFQISQRQFRGKAPF